MKNKKRVPAFLRSCVPAFLRSCVPAFLRSCVPAFLILLSAEASAADGAQSKGFYVQADIGLAREKLTNGGTNAEYKKQAVHPRFSAGYDFGQWRLALDYSRYRAIKKDAHASTKSQPFFETEYNAHNKVKSRSVGISAIYDFETQSPVKPYVGARLSVNHISIDFSDDGYIKNTSPVPLPKQILDNIFPGIPTIQAGQTVPFAQTTNHIGITRLGVGATAGVSYEITKNAALDLAYHYDDWGRLEGNRVRTQEISGGIRYTF
uniref:Nla_18150 protein n=2 Tax=Neisseria lactamica TaxID=486 RepID=R4NUF8_NEILA|nr:Nla_18150 protein [Neisseria lactamica]